MPLAAAERLPRGGRPARVVAVLIAALLVGGCEREQPGRRPDPAAVTDGAESRIAALIDLGTAALDDGEPHRALAIYRRALPLAEDLGDPFWRAVVHHSLGFTLDRLGESRAAIDANARAIALWRRMDRPGRTASSLHNQGLVYLAVADLDLARDHFEEAAELWRRTGDRRSLAITLDKLGVLLSDLGQHREGRQMLHEALRKRTDRRGRGVTAVSLSRVERRLGDLASARARALEARAIGEEVDDDQLVAVAWRDLGLVALAERNTEEALAAFSRAVALHRLAGDRLAEATTWVGAARAHRLAGELASARTSVEEALAIFETLRDKAASAALQTTLFARVRETYGFYVELLMAEQRRSPREGWAERALIASERSRSRSLLDTLALDGAQALDDRHRVAEERLQRRLDAAEARRSATPAGSVDREIRRINAELDALRPRRRPERAAPLESLAELRDELDPSTVLLAFALEEEHSYLWLVGEDTLTSVELAPRSELDVQARAAHRHLRRSHRREARGGRPQLCALADDLLGRIAGDLRDRRLVVVADGALAYLPFVALPDPRSPLPCSARPPLGAAHEIVHLPSASALRRLRRPASGQPSAGVLAVVADPLPDAGGGAGDGTPTDARAGLARLPGSRREAEAILTLVPASARFAALGAAATEATVRDALSGYRVLHFATHGVIDDVHPELSGLTLTRPAGAPAGDGLLRAHEISRLDLAAELVVLSACRTALGREVRGEGIFGLSRAFFAAGAPRVVVSLWDVDDRATTELMTVFYRRLLGDGMRPAAALREAQLELAMRRGFAAPYYWAGFVFQGDWR